MHCKLGNCYRAYFLMVWGCLNLQNHKNNTNILCFWLIIDLLLCSHSDLVCNCKLFVQLIRVIIFLWLWVQSWNAASLHEDCLPTVKQVAELFCCCEEGSLLLWEKDAIHAKAGTQIRAVCTDLHLWNISGRDTTHTSPLNALALAKTKTSRHSLCKDIY